MPATPLPSGGSDRRPKPRPTRDPRARLGDSSCVATTSTTKIRLIARRCIVRETLIENLRNKVVTVVDPNGAKVQVPIKELGIGYSGDPRPTTRSTYEINVPDNDGNLIITSSGGISSCNLPGSRPRSANGRKRRSKRQQVAAGRVWPRESPITMDKVKVILGYVAQVPFLAAERVAVIVGMVGWMSARGTLSDEFEKNKSAVTGKFSSLQGIQQVPNPPNTRLDDGDLGDLTKKEQKEVAATWQAVYEEQRKVLAWPDVMPARIRGLDQASFAQRGDSGGLSQGAIRPKSSEPEFPKLAKIVHAAPLGTEPAAAPRQRKSRAPPPTHRWPPSSKVASMGKPGCGVRSRWKCTGTAAHVV